MRIAWVSLLLVATLSACESGGYLLSVEPSFDYGSDNCPAWVLAEHPNVVCNPLTGDQEARVRGVFCETRWRWSDENCARVAYRFDDESRWAWDNDADIGSNNWTYSTYDYQWEITDFTTVTFLLDDDRFSYVVGHEAAHVDMGDGDSESWADDVSNYCRRRSPISPWGYTS
jgi:hypothetical protein